METKALKELAASVIVLYNTRLEDSLTYNALKNSLLFAKTEILLIVYDNSQQPQIITDFNKSSFPGKIIYIHDSTNPGVSKAYNEAAKIATNLQLDWILLFDQDTDFKEDALLYYMDAMLTTKEQIIAPILKDITGKFVYSPCSYKFKRGFWLKEINYGVVQFKNINFLNSGMCVSLDLFNSIGGFNEKIRLYYSDFDFFERVYMVKKTYLQLNYALTHSMESNTMESSEIAANRFRIYMRSVWEVSTFTNFKGKILYFMWAFLRSAKMCLIFRNFHFLKIFYNYKK